MLSRSKVSALYSLTWLREKVYGFRDSFLISTKKKSNVRLYLSPDLDARFGYIVTTAPVTLLFHEVFTEHLHLSPRVAFSALAFLFSVVHANGRLWKYHLRRLHLEFPQCPMWLPQLQWESRSRMRRLIAPFRAFYQH